MEKRGHKKLRIGLKSKKKIEKWNSAKKADCIPWGFYKKRGFGKTSDWNLLGSEWDVIYTYPFSDDSQAKPSGGRQVD